MLMRLALRKRGIASGLVAVHEAICKAYDIERIVLGKNHCDRPREHRRYGHTTRPLLSRVALGRVSYDEALLEITGESALNRAAYKCPFEPVAYD